MLVDSRALNLCLRDAGVHAERSTLVQVGAHLAEEHDLWTRLGIGRIVYVEAIPTLVGQLRERFAADPRVTVLEAVVSSTTGRGAVLLVNQPTYTSSLLNLEPVTLDCYPEITPGSGTPVTTTSLADLLNAHGLSPEILVIDVQGAEVEVLDGLGPMWTNVQVLMVEYQRTPLYAGAPSMDDLTSTG